MEPSSSSRTLREGQRRWSHRSPDERIKAMCAWAVEIQKNSARIAAADGTDTGLITDPPGGPRK
jgi:acyl-CoA reductase-like NAD-dependent aldehyde dehydrogenase